MPAPSPSRIRVVIADDHASIREALRQIVSDCADIEVAGEARNGAEAVALAHALRPDVVLMDARMPVMDGIEATRRILAECPAVKVVGTSTRPWPDGPHPFEHSGAVTYFEKGHAPSALIAALRAAALIR